MIQSAAEGYSTCEISAEGEIDAECEAETIANAIGLVRSVYNLEIPSFADAIGTMGVITSVLPFPAVAPALEAGAIFADKLEKGEPIDGQAVFDMVMAGS